MRADGPPIARLLMVVHVAVLGVPLLAFLGLRLADLELVESTERRLVAEAAVAAEAWRGAWLQAQGRPVDAPMEPPPWSDDARYWPVDPQVDPRRLEEAEPALSGTVREGDRTGPTWSAGAAVSPILRRAQRLNLAGVRVLDSDGCVVATSGGQLGECLKSHPEVAAALGGAYSAVGRRRVSDEPDPALTSFRRRGETRVFVALPVFDRGEVVAVVRASRTARDPLELAWRHRGLLAVGLLLCLAGAWGISRFLARSIARPVVAIRDEARRIADGPEHARLQPPSGPLPAEVAELADALATMTARLSARADDVVDFAAAVSHELKTPITSIRGAAELLQDAAGMSEDQRQRFLTHIDEDAARMQELVSRLLVLARIGSEPSGGGCDVGSELRSLAARHPDVVVDVPDVGRHGIAADRLVMAVGNLLQNAEEHGMAPVTLRVRRGDRLVIEVGDAGPGISEGNRDRVFDRFFTTRRDQGGTGLGLSIVQAVARAEGGDATLTTGPGGTTFRLEI